MTFSIFPTPGLQHEEDRVRLSPTPNVTGTKSGGRGQATMSDALADNPGMWNNTSPGPVVNNYHSHEPVQRAPHETSGRTEVIIVLAEFLGTFIYLFAAFLGAQGSQRYSIGNVAASGRFYDPFYVSISFGAAYAMALALFRNHTAGLYNPVVVLALIAVRKISYKRALMLLLAQFTASLVAAGIAKGLLPNHGSLVAETELKNGTTILQGFWLELLVTFLMVSALLTSTAQHMGSVTSKSAATMGLILFIAQLACVSFTGAGLNPFRSFAPAAIDNTFPGYHWIYWIGPVVGTCFAAAGHYVAHRVHGLEDRPARGEWAQAMATYERGQDPELGRTHVEKHALQSTALQSPPSPSGEAADFRPVPFSFRQTQHLDRMQPLTSNPFSDLRPPPPAVAPSHRQARQGHSSQGSVIMSSRSPTRTPEIPAKQPAQSTRDGVPSIWVRSISRSPIDLAAILDARGQPSPRVSFTKPEEVHPANRLAQTSSTVEIRSEQESTTATSLGAERQQQQEQVQKQQQQRTSNRRSRGVPGNIIIPARVSFAPEPHTIVEQPRPQTSSESDEQAGSPRSSGVRLVPSPPKRSSPEAKPSTDNDSPASISPRDFPVHKTMSPMSTVHESSVRSPGQEQEQQQVVAIPQVTAKEEKRLSARSGTRPALGQAPPSSWGQQARLSAIVSGAGGARGGPLRPRHAGAAARGSGSAVRQGVVLTGEAALAAVAAGGSGHERRRSSVSSVDDKKPRQPRQWPA